MKAVLVLVAAALHVATGCTLVCDCSHRFSMGEDAQYFSENMYRYSYYYSSYSWRYTANCSGHALARLPTGVDGDIRTLILSHNNITYLPNNGFADLGTTNLVILYLNNNSITTIEKNAFSELTSLKKLVLDGNKITALPLNLFEPCPALQYISLSGNNVILPNTNFLKGITHLETLKMTHCNLSTLPEDIMSTELDTLDISYNQLNNITFHFNARSLNASNNGRIYFTADHEYHSLQVLDLSGNTLVYSPDMTLNAPNLERLIVSHCNISDSFEHFFENINKIEILELSDTSIEKVNQSTIQSLLNLQELFIQDNNISSLEPNTFVNNEQLTKLNLSGNPLDIPQDEIFINSSSLQFLYLASCNITKITAKTFKKIPSLAILDLSQNRLKTVDESFHGLPALQRLFLDENSIKTLNPEAFINNIHLIVLTLSRNPLQLPLDAPFLHAPTIKILFINFCNITYLPLNFFKNMPYLTVIALRNNSITEVDVGVFQKLKNLQVIDLTGNPLTCDYRLKQVFRWCLQKEVTGHATCDKPKGDWRMLEHMHLVETPSETSVIPPTTTRTAPSTATSSSITTISSPSATTPSPAAASAHHSQELPTSSKRISTAVMCVLLAVGLVIGIAVGVALDVAISRRYLCFSLRARPAEKQTLFEQDS